MSPIRLRFPATSANLGPGFDAVGLAMSLFLEVDADVSDAFVIDASGRDASLVGTLKGNSILETYRQLAPAGPPLHLTIHNEIPLGFGCGSSAAALLAGVSLANHFGRLGLSQYEVMEEACRREGHPDNVAACALGGMTCSSMRSGRVTTAVLGKSLPWRLLLALPNKSLATAAARALLPSRYERADIVANIQSTALLVAAFALGRPELLLEATQDRLHQPYRAEACPLLALLLPMAGQHGIYSVTLSGAGPSVLLIADPRLPAPPMLDLIRAMAGDAALEVLRTEIFQVLEPYPSSV